MWIHLTPSPSPCQGEGGPEIFEGSGEVNLGILCVNIFSCPKRYYYPEFSHQASPISGIISA